MAAGRFEDGIAGLEEATRLEDSPMLKVFLASGYAEAGREREARGLLTEVERISRAVYTCAYRLGGGALR